MLPWRSKVPIGSCLLTGIGLHECKSQLLYWTPDRAQKNLFKDTTNTPCKHNCQPEDVWDTIIVVERAMKYEEVLLFCTYFISICGLIYVMKSMSKYLHGVYEISIDD